MTRIISGEAARSVLVTSLKPAVEAIGASLGPCGRATLYDIGQGRIGRATNGSAIAREFSGSGGPRSIAPRLLRETLFDAERDLGDGTARLAVILGGCFVEGTRMAAAGVPTGALADALLGLIPQISSRLAAEAASSYCTLAMVQAAGGDHNIAEALANLYGRTGADGMIEVVAGIAPGMSAEVESGFVLDAVLASPELAPGPPLITGAIDDVWIVVADEIVGDFRPLIPILEGFAARRKGLVVVARDICGPALQTLVSNKRELGLRVAAFRPRDVSQRAADVLEDLAIATGAGLIADRFGTNLAGLRPGMLGHARSLRFTPEQAVFLDPDGDAEAVATRRRHLAGEIDRQRYLALDREHLTRRRARLAGVRGEIRIGGRTTFETEALVATARAALASLRSADTSGVVSGGGVALARVAAGLMDKLVMGSPAAAAARCASAGLTAVAQRLAANAGAGPDVSPSDPLADPLALTQAIVERALSAAATMLRIETLVCE
jgi:chaperonin GroEL